jgi:hypothetical protein
MEERGGRGGGGDCPMHEFLLGTGRNQIYTSPSPSTGCAVPLPSLLLSDLLGAPVHTLGRLKLPTHSQQGPRIEPHGDLS